MKKIIPAIAMILTAMMLLTACVVSADNNSSTAPVTPVEPASPTTPEPENVDPVVGAWRMPPSPYGDDFTCYVVLNADGSFMNVTNLYDEGNTDSFTQNVSTNETFRWVKTSPTGIDLHYDYHDDNGEFVTSLTYNPRDDSLYFFDMLYATRDDSFELLK